jgi:hypothetical protein
MQSSCYYFEHKIDTIKNETAHHVEEVYQSPQIATIHVDSLAIPAFVLSQEILLDPSQTPALSGMSNSLLLRKTVNNLPIPNGECLAFPSRYDACHLSCGYTEQYFIDIVNIQDSLQKTIHLEAQSSGSFCRGYKSCSISHSSRTIFWQTHSGSNFRLKNCRITPLRSWANSYPRRVNKVCPPHLSFRNDIRAPSPLSGKWTNVHYLSSQVQIEVKVQADPCGALPASVALVVEPVTTTTKLLNHLRW